MSNHPSPQRPNLKWLRTAASLLEADDCPRAARAVREALSYILHLEQSTEGEGGGS